MPRTSCIFRTIIIPIFLTILFFMILSLNIFHSDNSSLKRQYFSINVLKSLVEEEDQKKFGALTIGDINIDDFIKDIDKEDVQYNRTIFTDQDISGKIL